MNERPPGHTRPTRLHHRGEYTQPKDAVPPRLPNAIYPEGKDLPKDRLELAQWLVSRENPLAARVVVNRHWAAFFGTGIVPTLDDFGMQGQLPTQPAGVTEIAYGSPKWNPSNGEDRFRRSVYTYQKRTAPFAMFTTFDAGSGEACLAKRDRSNTPLQALTLMNDPMFIEIAQHFGKTLEKSEGTPEEKITFAFRKLLTRPPTPEEVRNLSDFHQKHPSWSALTRVLLSLDESVTKN